MASMNLFQFSSHSFASLFQNLVPQLHDHKIKRVLKKGGTLNVVENHSNKNFGRLWDKKGDTEYFEHFAYIPCHIPITLISLWCIFEFSFIRTHFLSIIIDSSCCYSYFSTIFYLIFHNYYTGLRIFDKVFS